MLYTAPIYAALADNPETSHQKSLRMSEASLSRDHGTSYGISVYPVFSGTARTPNDCKTMLRNITRHRILAIGHVETRLINGTINPIRRDVQLVERNRVILRALSSHRVSFDRKKQSTPFGCTFIVEKRLPDRV